LAPVAVLVYVPDVRDRLAWYQTAFPEAVPIYHSEFDLTVLDLNGFSLEIVQVDEKVDSGKKGTVVYWAVGNLTDALTHFEALGAKRYRSPMVIENGLAMCQIEDPFGNLIGLRGPAT